MEPIKVVLADFDDEQRQATAASLEMTNDIEVVGSTAWGTKVVPLLLETCAQVLVMELALLGCDGLAVLRQIKARLGTQISIVVYSAFTQDSLVHYATQMGTVHFLAKPVSVTSLREHIRLAASHSPQFGMPVTTLEVRAALLLQQLGLLPNRKGYRYLHTALCLAVTEPESVCEITKWLYPEVARIYGVSSAAVERSIRQTIEWIWVHGSRSAREYYFPFSRITRSGHPTNSAFIALLSQHLRSSGELLR